MSKKKSYMNRKSIQEGILVEGFFDKLFKLLKLKGSDKNKVKRSKSIKKSLFSLNKRWAALEKNISKETGKPFKFKGGPFTIKDFL